VADLFWQSRAKRGSFDAHPAPSSAFHALVVTPMAAKDFAGFMSHARPGRDCRQPFVSGHSAPQRVSNLRTVTKLWMDFRMWRA
jgi:hypothetical protein